MAQTVAVVGTGYVGLVTAVGLSDFGNQVLGVDLKEEIVSSLNEGVPTIYETGLKDYLDRNLKAGRLSFSSNLREAVKTANIIFIAVGTPPREDGSADTSQLDSAVASIAREIDHFTVVVTKSTVPVGTNRRIARRLAEINPSGEFAVVSNPEFLREGKAVQDFFHPDRIVLGFDTDAPGADRAREMLEDLYRSLYLIQTPFVVCSLETAELIKYASNAFLATKITFVNQMANLAEACGADVHQLARAMGMDGRIGSKFLHPGPGYGGSCFPKDTRALAATGEEFGVDLSLVGEVIRANEAQKHRVAAKLGSMLPGGLSGKQVAVLGVTFKAETDDVRESPALTVVRDLLSSGARVAVQDPQGLDGFSHYFGEEVSYHRSEFDCVREADAVLVLTEWNEYRNLDFTRVGELMRGRVLLDVRNVLEPEKMRAIGFNYAGTGRGKRAGLNLK